jgi:hypothetical protein
VIVGGGGARVQIFVLESAMKFESSTKSVSSTQVSVPLVFFFRERLQVQASMRLSPTCWICMVSEG